jgi:hypothetical protein
VRGYGFAFTHSHPLVLSVFVYFIYELSAQFSAHRSDVLFDASQILPFFVLKDFCGLLSDAWDLVVHVAFKSQHRCWVRVMFKPIKIILA